MAKKKRKKNKIDKCLNCHIDFYHYSWDEQKYCSTKCHYDKKKIKVNCNSCGKELLKCKSNFDRNEEHYCDRNCYNTRNSKDLKKIKRHTSYFTELVEKGCECGVKDFYLLQIHHKDGNPENNNLENHEVVCANCHIKRHLKLNKKGKLIYHTKTLTSPEILKLL